MLLVLPMCPGEDCSAAAALSCFQYFALEHQVSSCNEFRVGYCRVRCHKQQQYIYYRQVPVLWYFIVFAGGSYNQLEGDSCDHSGAAENKDNHDASLDNGDL